MRGVSSRVKSATSQLDATKSDELNHVNCTYAFNCQKFSLCLLANTLYNILLLQQDDLTSCLQARERDSLEFLSLCMCLLSAWGRMSFSSLLCLTRSQQSICLGCAAITSPITRPPRPPAASCHWLAWLPITNIRGLVWYLSGGACASKRALSWYKAGSLCGAHRCKDIKACDHLHDYIAMWLKAFCFCERSVRAWNDSFAWSCAGAEPQTGRHLDLNVQF